MFVQGANERSEAILGYFSPSQNKCYSQYEYGYKHVSISVNLSLYVYFFLNHYILIYKNINGTTRTLAETVIHNTSYLPKIIKELNVERFKVAVD